MRIPSLSSHHYARWRGGWSVWIHKTLLEFQGVNSVVFIRYTKKCSPFTSIVLDLAETLFTPETPKVSCGLKPLQWHSGEYIMSAFSFVIIQLSPLNLTDMNDISRQTQHQWCWFYTRMIHISTVFFGEKKNLSRICFERSEQLCIMLQRGLAGQIKEAQTQWTPRHLALHNVCRNHFSSKLSLHCLPADTNLSFHCGAKIGLKKKRGWKHEQIRCCWTLQLLQQSRKTGWHWWSEWDISVVRLTLRAGMEKWGSLQIEIGW